MLAAVEFAIDKVPALDSVGHAVRLPLAATSGAILFASQTGAVSSMHPGLAVIVSLWQAERSRPTVHVTRAGVRPVANLALLGPPLSLLEDFSSTTLSLAALLVPIVVPFLFALLGLGALLLWDRRRTARQTVPNRR